MAKLTPEEIDRKVEEIARRMKYEGYMQSNRWWARRKSKLIAANWTCQRCGYNQLTAPVEIPLDVHHLTYGRLGDELDSDLIVLCRPCHEKEHGRLIAPPKRVEL